LPIALIALCLNIALIVHAAKTGRFTPWGWIILLLPPFGGIAYAVVEVLPGFFRSARGRTAQREVARRVNPEKDYRVLRDRLDDADTVANRASFAEECAALGKWQETWEQYDSIVRRPNGNEPTFHLGLAEANLMLRRPSDTLAILDALKAREPDYESARGHMLYARALAEAGQTEEALDAFETISQYAHSYEARARYAALLAEVGRVDAARQAAREILDRLRRSPAHVRKLQAEWGRMAEDVLRGS